LPSENKYAILPAKPVAAAITRIPYSGCCSGTGRAYKLKVQVLKIAPEANRELLEECQSLKEYMLLMEQVRKYAAFLELNEAVDRDVNKCIRDGILSDLLSTSSASGRPFLCCRGPVSEAC
jgi:hypothetical protein